MIIEKFKKYVGTPFSVGCRPVDNDPGTWSSTEVSIYRDDVMIGQYIRNYFANAADTFSPFLVNDTWYALYCPNYIEVRVMKLHDTYVEDWCGTGEDQDYIPVEIFMPQYRRCETEVNGSAHAYYVVNSEYESDAEFVQNRDQWAIEDRYCKFAFASGYDAQGGLQLRYIQLQQIADKIASVSDMDQWELPTTLPLRTCIDMSQWEPERPIIQLLKSQQMLFNDGC